MMELSARKRGAAREWGYMETKEWKARKKLRIHRKEWEEKRGEREEKGEFYGNFAIYVRNGEIPSQSPTD